MRHEDYIPGEFLPTFNSHTIELNFHRIPGLSEQFDKAGYETAKKGETFEVFYHDERPKDFYYDGSYHEVDSSEMAFKIAGSMAFKEAMRKADPVLLEPIMKVVIHKEVLYNGKAQRKV